MSFPKYEHYKDSGVEWLGEVPAHWAVQPMKRQLRLLTEKTSRRAHPVALENIESWTGRFIATETEFEGDGVAFEADDILFGKLRPYLAKALVARAIGEAVGDFLVMRPTTEVDSNFVLYQILNRVFVSIVDGSTFGSKMPRCSWDFVGSVKVAFPPRNEQTEIAAFLDYETAKIDALIAEQQRLFELLKEKRQALISQAVTKGLSPCVPMKNSGVEWLGEVPAHWTLKRIKHVKAKIGNAFVDGPFGSNLKSEHFIEDGEVLVIESSFATQGQLFLDELKTISLEHFRTIDRSEARGGDLIIAKIGAQFGKSSILPSLPKPAVVSGNSLKLTLDDSICDNEFIHWQLVNLKNLGAIDLIVNGSAQPALSLAEMNSLPVSLPPLHEQRAISQFVKRALDAINAHSTEAGRAITLLQERRSALISAAVTGKIDVRGTAFAS